MALKRMENENYFMATAIKWVNHMFICVSVDQGGTELEWCNETKFVCLENLFSRYWGKGYCTIQLA